MRRIALVVAAYMGGLSAMSETYYWEGGVATNPRDAADCSLAANWNPTGGPKTSADVGIFHSVSSEGYVRNLSADPVAVLRLGIDGAKKVSYIGDATVALSTTSVDPIAQGVNYYAPVEITGPGSHYFKNTLFAGDVKVSGGILFPHSGWVELDYSRHAEKAGGEYRPSCIDRVSSYGGEFWVDGPASRASALTMNFDVEKDSDFVKNLGGYSAATIPVGTLVTGAGIPEGTYVKRIFGSAWVQLSQAVTETNASTPLRFAAQTADFYLRIGEIGHNNSGTTFSIYLIPSATTSSGARFEVEIDALNLWSTWTFLGNYDQSGVPPRIVLHDNSDVAGGLLRVGTSRILFAERSVGKTPGLPQSIVKVDNANTIAYLCVTGGMSAVIGTLASVTGKVVKEGSGTLSVGMAGGEVAANAGAIEVSDGTFAILGDGAAAPVSISSVRVSAKGTLVLPEQGVVCSSFDFEDGATVSGPGVLTLPDSCPLSGLKLVDGASVCVTGTGRVIRDTDVASVPGDPAFWVDCSDADSLVVNENFSVFGESFPGVVRVNDCRKTADGDGYLYATNASGGVYLPRLIEEPTTGRKGMQFDGNWDNTHKPSGSDTMVWSAPVYNIRAVFQVMSMLANSTRGGNFLGTTPCDWMTENGSLDGVSHLREWGRYVYPYNEEVFSWGMPGGGNAIREGDLYFDGILADYTRGYPYPSYRVSNVLQDVPFVASLQTKKGCAVYPAADSFEYLGGDLASQNLSGHKIFHELLVYTNDVTEAERVEITAYLMKKWKKANVSFVTMPASGSSLGVVSGDGYHGAIVVPAGSERIVDSISGAATLGKKGGGLLVLNGVSGGSASLAVDEGTLEVRSASADESILPDGAFVHFDASRTDTLTYSVVGGVTNVRAWADARSGSVRRATISTEQSPCPTLRSSDLLNGGNYVDFGAAIRMTESDKTRMTSLGFDESSGELRTVIAVCGAEHGGGNLVGDNYSKHDWNTRYSLARGGEATTAVGGDRTASIVRPMTMPRALADARGSRFRLNGEACNPNETGLAEGFNVVSLVSREHFGAGALSGVSGEGAYFCGGEQFAEYILYPQALSEAEVAGVEAYLRKKWFGLETPGFAPVEFASVSVAQGATLKVVGNGPVVVKRLGPSAGLVDGKLALASSSAVIEADVAQDGSVSGGLVASGGISIPSQGTVLLTGAVRGVAVGRHVLASNVTAADGVSGWVFDCGSLQPNRNLALSVEGGDLVLTVSKRGFALICR